MKVGLTLLTITIFSSAPTPIKSSKISFFNRNRGDGRTEETTTIRTYQPKYKTLFYFRQLLPNSTFSTIPAEVVDNSSLSPPLKTSFKPIPSLVEELSTDPSFIVSSIVEPSVTSFSESISTHSQQFPSSSFSGSVDSFASFSPIFSSSDSTSSVPDSVSSADSTTPSSFLPFKSTSSSKFNMPNLLHPSNSMTNFFKSLARSPKASLTPFSTINPAGALSVMKPPSSVMKPPSPVLFPSSIPQPLDNFSSSFPSQTSISAAESTSSLSLEIPPLSTSSVNPSFSDSNSSRFPKDLASPISPLSTSAGSISSHGSTIIVAASNPSEGSSSLSRIPKSLSTTVYSSSSDLSVNGDYNFSYRVNDTIQDFGHSEQRVGNNTQGRYDVVLPDGRRQIVDYHVLNAAYFADVSYTGETTSRATNLEPASTTSVASLVTNAKIEENMDFPI